MPRLKFSGSRLFVLDTNVLLHDPTSIFRFAEHNVYLPMVVLEELDNGKKGMSEVARNARQVSRYFDQLMESASEDEINKGLPLGNSPYLPKEERTDGLLFFQTSEIDASNFPTGLATSKVDNTIVSIAHTLQRDNKDKLVTLISKDINLRIKAKILGVHAEDYFNDQVLDDLESLFTGQSVLPNDFWESHDKEMKSWKEEGRTFYRISGPLVKHWVVNQFVYMEDGSEFSAIVRETNGDEATIELAKDHSSQANDVWGVTARNIEQSFALNLLMDPEIDFVTLQGPAGTGKTLLALAAALEQTIESKLYNEIIVTRVTVPVGEDIGFLPGTEEEKMNPWMGAFTDNLEVLSPSQSNDDWGRQATQDILQKWLKVRSLNFMRGRTFINKFVIIDEAQNLTPKQMKTLITRAGPGTKVVCLGNVAQIDTPYLTETSSGISYVVDHFKNWKYGGHIKLIRGERSRLADFASENL
ncbi:PhoH family protein [Aliikangiella coralliicola]|uniref:PhoH family protein n=1 Tax=Aliikangiella coralliicola TaxID=2592383 RepID=A0A545U8Q9_9GAMM|nr:PhoH family protein [Aliikangiella coralliicola]TQV85793.1 PhoH family protein [Aliikangiella coralliicola]